MTLIKTSLLNAIAVAIRMLSMLGINKILALYLGPSGYAAIGQFQNAIQIINVFASGALNTGVTKYTAEYRMRLERQILVWRTAGTFAIATSLISGFIVILFSNQLASFFLKDESLGSVFIWFSIVLPLFVVNALILAILNGKKEVRLYVCANICGSFFALLITSIMVIYLGLYGALAGLAIYQGLNFFVSFTLIYRCKWFQINYLFGVIDWKVMRDLSKYAAMALTSAICIPTSHIFVRNYLGENIGWDAAGYWEAMWRLSLAYLMFVTTTLGVYYLPRLAELDQSSEIKKEILQGYKIILPIAILLGVGLYVLRDFVILFLFTSEFNEVEALFAWQIVGDTLKIGSWILAYLVLSKAMTKIFIATEVFCSVSFILIATQAIDRFGLEGVVIAHALNYLLYWFVMAWVVMRFLKRNGKSEPLT